MRRFIDITEKFYAGVSTSWQGRETGTEVFSDPTPREWKELVEHDQVRAILTDEGILVWNPYGALHRTVMDQLDLSNRVIPCVIHGSPGEACHVQITDSSKDTIWWHNDQLYDEVVHNPYLNRMFTDIEVSYYDEDIVGDWQSLNDDEDEDEELTESVERVQAWGGHTVAVHHNPTKQQFERLVERHRAIRGLLRGNDLWVWDAGAAIHSNMMQELGLPESTDCLSYADGRWTGPIYDYNNPDQYAPPIQRITPRPTRNRDDAELEAIFNDPDFAALTRDYAGAK